MRFHPKYRCERVWESFSGSGPIRHCEGCNQYVYDYLALSTKQQIYLRKDPHACLRIPLALHR